jgi:hypothetical protein
MGGRDWSYLTRWKLTRWKLTRWKLTRWNLGVNEALEKTPGKAHGEWLLGRVAPIGASNRAANRG